MGMIIDYLKYYFKAKNVHGVHSPFVFDFYQNVFKNQNTAPGFEAIESLRKELLKRDTEIIKIIDYGAGPKKNSSNERIVSEVAKISLSSPKWCKFLYHLVRHYRLNNIVELGTSLGITSCYLGYAAPDGIVYSLEGASAYIDIARQNYNKLGLKNVLTSEGNIDLTLIKTLRHVEWVDLVFFDANHRYEPTIRYFETCLKKSHPGSVFIFDDIHWSKEMNQAWEEIISRPEVSISINLFQMGLVFFNEGVEKQHFILK